MRELIRKIIRESSFTAAPQWFKDWEALPVEKRIESIEMRKKYIIKMIPKIIKFFKHNFGDKLKDVSVEEEGAYYGHELYSTQIPKLTFYFKQSEMEENPYHEIAEDLSNFFNIDYLYYAIPLSVKVEWI